MHFRITGDTDQKSGIGNIITAISGATRKHFIPQNYGDGLSGIAVILMCRNPEINFKQRIRHSKKEKLLYIDVMLDYPQICEAESKIRESIVFCEISLQVGLILKKRMIPDFASERFISDLNEWFEVLKSRK